MPNVLLGMQFSAGVIFGVIAALLAVGTVIAIVLWIIIAVSMAREQVEYDESNDMGVQ